MKQTRSGFLFGAGRQGNGEVGGVTHGRGGGGGRGHPAGAVRLDRFREWQSMPRRPSSSTGARSSPLSTSLRAPGCVRRAAPRSTCARRCCVHHARPPPACFHGVAHLTPKVALPCCKLQLSSFYSAALPCQAGRSVPPGGVPLSDSALRRQEGRSSGWPAAGLASMTQFNSIWP